MTKVGYLPDISGNFVRWRMEYLRGISMNDWQMAALGLHNMNGALDADYRLPISTEKWNEKQDGYVVWSCTECTTGVNHIYNEGEENQYSKVIQVPTTSKRKDIHIFIERCTDVIALLSGKTQREMWICPKCDNISSVTDVQKKMMKYPEPHFRGCIYAEPTRPLTGLMRRRGTYPRQMRAWVKFYSLELEHQLALYRLEYIKVNGHDMEDGGSSGYDERGGD